MSKRSFLKLASMAAVAVVLAGCAASGAKFQEVASTMPKLKANEGRVYFFRSAAFAGGAVQPDIRLNGQVVGESKPGGFFYVDRPAGNYSATTATETQNALSFALQAGETKYVRSSVSMGIMVGRVVLDLESADKANAELASLSYTGAAKPAAK